MLLIRLGKLRQHLRRDAFQQRLGLRVIFQELHFLEPFNGVALDFNDQLLILFSASHFH